MMGLALDVDGSGNDELIQVIVHALTAYTGRSSHRWHNQSRGFHATEVKETTTFLPIAILPI